MRIIKTTTLAVILMSSWLLASAQVAGKGKSPRALLERYGPLDVVSHLISLVQDSQSPFRASAVRMLGRLKAKSAIWNILTLLKETDIKVRRQTVIALGRIGEQAAVEPLMAALEDPDRSVIAASARALGRLKARMALSRLLSTFENYRKKPYPGVQKALIWALGALGDQKAAAPLLAVLSAKPGRGRWAVRVASAIALGRLQAKGAYGEVLKTARLAYRKGRSKYLPALIQALTALGKVKAALDIGRLMGRYPAVDFVAARALAGLGDKNILKIIGRSLRRWERGRFKAFLVKGIGPLGREHLLAMLHYAMAVLGDGQAPARLLSLLKSADTPSSSLLAHMLAIKLGAKNLRGELLKIHWQHYTGKREGADPSCGLRLRLLTVLAGLALKGGWSWLGNFAVDICAKVRRKARVLMGRDKARIKDVAERLIAYVRQLGSHPERARRAAGQFLHLGRKAGKLLITLAGDAQATVPMRILAINTLGRMAARPGGVPAARALKQASASFKKKIRKAAREALRRLAP